MTFRYDAGKATVRGQEFPLTVDGAGRWHTEIAGSGVNAETRAALVEKLAKATRAATVKVEVPFCQLTGRGPGMQVARLVAYGVHGGNGNVLVRDAAGKTSQVDKHGYYGDQRLRDMPEGEQAEWVALAKAARDAAQALSTFQAARAIDLPAAVEAAIAAATGQKGG